MGHETINLLAEAQGEIESRPTMWELGNSPIKRCPFCASDDITVIGHPSDELTWCRCMACRAEGPPRPNRPTAIAAWQTRRL